jgi:hypothetical protein
MDLASWSVFIKVHKQVPAALLCFVSRPVIDYNLTQLAQIIASSGSEACAVELAGVDELSIERIMIACFDGLPEDERPSAVASNIIQKFREKTSGNPLLCRNYTMVLKEQNLVTISRKIRVNPTLVWAHESCIEEFEKIVSSGEGISTSILAQFDKLETSFAELLRCVSCVDERFDLTMAAVAMGKISGQAAAESSTDALIPVWQEILLTIEMNDRFLFLERADGDASRPRTIRSKFDSRVNTPRDSQPASPSGESTETFANSDSPGTGENFIQAPVMKFRHLNYMTTIYGTVPLSRRAKIHQAVATYLSCLLTEENEMVLLPKVSSAIHEQDVWTKKYF